VVVADDRLAEVAVGVSLAHASEPMATPSRPANAATNTTSAAASGTAMRSRPAEVAMTPIEASGVEDPGNQPARAAALQIEREPVGGCAGVLERGHRACGRGGRFDD
jgi:hypothetical protein